MSLAAKASTQEIQELFAVVHDEKPHTLNLPDQRARRCPSPRLHLGVVQVPRPVQLPLAFEVQGGDQPCTKGRPASCYRSFSSPAPPARRTTLFTFTNPSPSTSSAASGPEKESSK